MQRRCKRYWWRNSALTIFVASLKVSCATAPPPPETLDLVYRNEGVPGGAMFYGFRGTTNDVVMIDGMDPKMQGAQCRMLDDQRKYDLWVEDLKRAAAKKPR